MKESVTLRDIYDAVSRLEDKMMVKIDRNETRIESLENNQSKAFGVIGFFALFISAGASYLWDKILGNK